MTTDDYLNQINSAIADEIETLLETAAKYVGPDNAKAEAIRIARDRRDHDYYSIGGWYGEILEALEAMPWEDAPLDDTQNVVSEVARDRRWG